MTWLTPMLEWLQSTTLAAAVGDSLQFAAVLSSAHLVGLTLVVGGALVSGLRMVGLLLPDGPVTAVAGAARRGIVVGLLISVSSGVLLLAPRALWAFESSFFRIKMLWLLAAVALHVVLAILLRRPVEGTPLSVRVLGGLQVVAWFGVAVNGCLYILLE
jgi:hypothetical protein